MSDADSATGRHAIASSDGWMLLHLTAVLSASVTEVLDRLGLQPGGDGRMRFGGIDIDWCEGDAAQRIAGAWPTEGDRLFGLAHPPPSVSGELLAFRVADRQRAAGVQPLLRLCTAVGLVAAATEADSVGWLPAKLWSSATLFGEAVVATERQGLPPIMHLVAFEAVPSGIVTHGLAWFCGHELRLTAPLGYPEREALRRAARLAIDAFMHDGLAGPMTVAGIDKGEMLAIGRRVDDRPGPTVPVAVRPPPG